jgi:hypothetical protein
MDNGLVALRAINDSAGDLDLSLRQLEEFSVWLDDNDTDLVSFMDSLDSANRALVGATPEFRASLRSVPTFLDDFSKFQMRIEDDLGSLIQDGATLAELLAPRTDQIVDLIVQLEPFTTVWNSGLSQPCEGPYESDMTCWQLYQMPGLESRGLYGTGESPLSNEPGDPLYQVAGGVTEQTRESLHALLSRMTGRRAPNQLVNVLLAPIRDSLPELQVRGR